jgi:hypothetical protein
MTTTPEEIAYNAVLAHFQAHPELIDPKFGGDAAKAAESFRASQSKITTLSQQLAAARGTPKPTAPVGGIEIPETPQLTPANALSILRNEVTATGTVSAATLALLAAAGLDQTVVNEFVAAYKTNAQSQRDEAIALLGGEAEYTATVAYIGTLPELEKQAARSALSGPGWRTYLKGAQARLRDVNPGTSREVQGSGAMTTGSGTNNAMTFQSFEEAQHAMRDPKYQSDPVYRKNVEDGLTRLYSPKK